MTSEKSQLGWNQETIVDHMLKQQFNRFEDILLLNWFLL